MKRIATGFVVVAAGLVWGGSDASAQSSKLTGAEIQSLLVNNTAKSWTSRGGDSFFYYKADGEIDVKNGKGETGTATYEVKDNSICITWTKPYSEWRVANGCTEVTKSGDASYEMTVNGSSRTVTILPGKGF